MFSFSNLYESILKSRWVRFESNSLAKFNQLALRDSREMYELRELTPALAKKAAAELNESPENIEHKLKALKEWVLAQNHLRSRTNDQFLIVFLRGAKYSLERAKHKLENYYISRMKMPELFYNRNLDDPKIQTILKSRCLLNLPAVAADGPRVLMIRPNRFDLSKHTVEDVFMVGTLATDILIHEDDNAIVAGYIIILDLSNLPKEVIYAFNPGFVRKLILIVNKASPSRMKGFHILNVPLIFTKLFDMIKNVINEKLRDRIYIHNGNLETIKKHMPIEILPKEYGGDFDESDWGEKWMQKIHDNRDFFKEEETYGLIGDMEKLSQCGKKSDGNEFGVEGSFRKLCFD